MTEQLAGQKTIPLQLGDDWSAIQALAGIQSDPKKAVAELIENGIDAHATMITVRIAKVGTDHYLEVTDNGDGVRPDAAGVPDMERIPVNIANSFKRKLADRTGIQGKFAIGILGFWSLGETYTITSRGESKRTRSLKLVRESRNSLVSESAPMEAPGSHVIVTRLNPEAIRVLTAPKLVPYLAEELRGRLGNTVHLTVDDTIRGQRETVKPAEFNGRRLSEFGTVTVPGHGRMNIRLHLLDTSEGATGHVALRVGGTAVWPSLTNYSEFNRPPWSSGRVEGYIDYPNLEVTPDRRDVRKDEFFTAMTSSLSPIEARLLEVIKLDEEHQNERLDHEVIEKLRKEFSDIRGSLPPHLDWFMGRSRKGEGPPAPPPPPRDYQEAGPLFRIKILPEAINVEFGHERSLRVEAYDDHDVPIDPATLIIVWAINGDADPKLGSLLNNQGPKVHFQAGETSGSVTLQARAIQRSFTKHASAVIVIVPAAGLKPPSPNARGPRFPQVLPKNLPGDPRRSWMESTFDIIYFNKGHPDFLICNRKPGSRLRYLEQLVAKELIVYNRPNFKDTAEMFEEYVGLLVHLEAGSK
jgi:hypothetical protein